MTDRRQQPSGSREISSEAIPKKITDSAPDVILLCGGERISCHRAILSKASSYFSAMFNSSFAEKDEPLITIKDVDGFILRILVDLSYGYPLELENEKMMLSLLETASMLQFLSVQKRCVEFLLHSLTGTNALQFFALGDMIGVPELSRQSFAYLLYHFDTIAESRELLGQLHVELLIKIVGHPNLNCESEIEILHVINRWIADQNDTVPRDSVLELFSCVRFKVLSVNDIESVSSLAFIQDSKMLTKLVSILRLKMEGEDVELNPCRCHCHNKTSSLHLKMEGCQTCFQSGQVSDETEVDSDQEVKVKNRSSFCPSAPSDCRLREIFRSPCCSKKAATQSLIHPDDSIEAKVCYPPDILNLADSLLSTPPRAPPFVPCVVGHTKRKEIPSDGPSLKKPKQVDGPSLLKFNFKTRDFQSLVQLSKVHEGPVEASGYKVCTLGKDVYIFGGEYMFGYSNWQNSVWRWDSFKNIWSIETSLLSPRRHHSICIYDEYIYLIGGYGKHRIILDTVDRYDTYKCSWKRCASLPSPLYSAACCHYKGLIYVFSHQIFTYDPNRDEWQTLANVRVPSDSTFSQAMSVKNNGIYLTSVYSNLLYHFDPDAESLEVGVVGEFGNNVLNSCYVESLKSIFTFSTAEVTGSAGFPSVHQVETFDLDSKLFSVLWKENSSQGFLTDFGIRHSLGCFSFLYYE